MPAITPMLWFDGEAEEAARFYLSTFPALASPTSSATPTPAGKCTATLPVQ